jgi:hypothetical protein
VALRFYIEIVHAEKLKRSKAKVGAILIAELIIEIILFITIS